MDNNQLNFIIDSFYELAKWVNEDKSNHPGLRQKLNFIVRQLPARTDKEQYYMLQVIAEMFVEHFKLKAK